ncbi:glycosyltransferase [Coprobacter sp.]
MIGLFNDGFPPIMDGVSLTVKNYAYWLNRKNENVCVVTPKIPGIDYTEKYPVYRYTSIPIPMRKPYRLGFPRIDLPFYEHICKRPFSLVHAHCPFSSGELAMRIAHNQHIPIVATFHSKYRDDFKRVIPNKTLLSLLVRKVIRFYEAADEVWIPQAAVEETIREYGYKGKVEIVDNGTEFSGSENVQSIKTDMRKELGISKNELMFLFVGQHIREKNPGLIIDALSLIKEKPFRMFFIGSGYAEDELHQQVKRLGLENKIKFIGTLTDREQLKRYYAAADLFLFPSLYDNAPLVVREAASMQTPSLLISGATSAEIVEDARNGFLCGRSVAEFAEKLTELIQSPEKIRQAGTNASGTIARSWENVAEEVRDRYKSLLKRYA